MVELNAYDGQCEEIMHTVGCTACLEISKQRTNDDDDDDDDDDDNDDDGRLLLALTKSTWSRAYSDVFLPCTVAFSCGFASTPFSLFGSPADVISHRTHCGVFDLDLVFSGSSDDLAAEEAGGCFSFVALSINERFIFSSPVAAPVLIEPNICFQSSFCKITRNL